MYKNSKFIEKFKYHSDLFIAIPQFLYSLKLFFIYDMSRFARNLTNLIKSHKSISAIKSIGKHIC